MEEQTNIKKLEKMLKHAEENHATAESIWADFGFPLAKAYLENDRHDELRELLEKYFVPEKFNDKDVLF